MYMPFLRGKQFELLALREVASNLGRASRIHPVIEPVRGRGDALGRCLDELAMFQVPVTVIVNPRVGELADENGASAITDILARRVNRDSLRLGICVRSSTDFQELSTVIARADLGELPLDLIHEEFAGAQDLHALSRDDTIHLVPGKEAARRYRPALKGDLVKLTDRFPYRKTNLEYVGAAPSLFTDDNLYFEEDGYLGFSDYLTIGENFTEGGSSPRAVVIHLTYAEDDGSIWIRHFCSFTNADTSDVAGKFGEAVGQVVAFARSRGMNNQAITSFTRYAEQGAYPGLGVVKKLSIQNHLWLLRDALAER